MLSAPTTTYGFYYRMWGEEAEGDHRIRGLDALAQAALLYKVPQPEPKRFIVRRLSPLTELPKDSLVEAADVVGACRRVSVVAAALAGDAPPLPFRLKLSRRRLQLP